MGDSAVSASFSAPVTSFRAFTLTEVARDGFAPADEVAIPATHSTRRTRLQEAALHRVVRADPSCFRAPNRKVLRELLRPRMHRFEGSLIVVVDERFAMTPALPPFGRRA